METRAKRMRLAAASSDNAKTLKSFADLPLELLTKIMLECSGADKLKRVALVNHQFHSIVNDPAAWSNIARVLLSGEKTMSFNGGSLNLGFSAPPSAVKVQSVCRFVESSLKNVKYMQLGIADYPAQLRHLIAKLIVDWKLLQNMQILLRETYFGGVPDVGYVLLFYHQLMRQIAASPDLCEKLKLSISFFGTHFRLSCDGHLFKQCLHLALKCPIKELVLDIEVLIYPYYSKQNMFKDVAIESLNIRRTEGNQCPNPWGNQYPNPWGIPHPNLCFADYSHELLAAINQLRPNTLKNFGENEGHIHYDYLKSECGITKFLSAINDSQLSAVSSFLVRGRRIEPSDPDPAVHMHNSLNLLHTVKSVLRKMPNLCELVVKCEQADNDTFEWQLQPTMDMFEELMMRAKQQPKRFEAFFHDFPHSPFELSALKTQLDEIFKPELYTTQIEDNKRDIELTCLESGRTLKMLWY